MRCTSNHATLSPFMRKITFELLALDCNTTLAFKVSDPYPNGTVSLLSEFEFVYLFGGQGKPVDFKQLLDYTFIAECDIICSFGDTCDAGRS